ncbi:MAG: hypothetical protein MZV70_51740 [Desulfobacterales bacterium]|nr:hypothetical protein [Desulfobacterales bacterium]
MPRKARIDAPGAFHHIIVRGIDRTAIFRDDTDYENFLSRLSRLLIESSTPCLGMGIDGQPYACAFADGTWCPSAPSCAGS